MTRSFLRFPPDCELRLAHTLPILSVGQWAWSETEISQVCPQMSLPCVRHTAKLINHVVDMLLGLYCSADELEPDLEPGYNLVAIFSHKWYADLNKGPFYDQELRRRTDELRTAEERLKSEVSAVVLEG